MFTLPKTTRIGGSETALPLKEIVKRLKDTYCNNIGVEYMFINDRSKCKFYLQYQYYQLYLHYLKVTIICRYIYP